MKYKNIKTVEYSTVIYENNSYISFIDNENNCFSKEQINEIIYGIENGLTAEQIKIYKNTNYSAKQMCEIRLGLQQGVDVKKYLNKNLHRNEMRRIRKMLYKNK